jgi:magnesium transporter
MIFFSTLLRQNVFDNEGRRLGTLHDLCVTLNETFPVVTALIVRNTLSTLSNTTMIIPWSQVNSLDEPQIRLTVKQSELQTYIPQPDELLLRRDILDKQIVDTQGFRVVKVNDLQLAQIKKTVRLVGVDIGLSSLLRRLGILKPVEVISHVLPIRLAERTITWNYVEPIQVIKAGAASGATGQLALAGPAASVSTGGIVSQVQLNVSHNKLADLRPADIADILEQLDAEEASAMLERLDTETAADALNEVESPLQYDILSELDPERASDLLETLAPDDAADILADLPPEVAERLLNLMPIAESRSIRELLRYGSETAGGIMTNEVLSLAQDMTVEEALVYLRQHSEHMEMVYYLYIVDAEQRLAGVVSLRELVVAEPATRLKDLMSPDVIKVSTSMDQEQVAQVIAKYDLLGVPVVDSDNRLVGLVTVDDVIDVIHEEQAEDFSDIAGTSVEEFEEEEHVSWRATLNRVIWLSVNLVAGFIVALILNQLLGPILSAGNGPALTGLTAGLRSHVALNGIVCLIPMLLFTSGSVGSQALGVAGWQLRSSRGSDFWRGMFRELRLGTLGGVLATIVVGLITWLLFHSLPLGLAVGLGSGFTLLVAAVCGLSLPTLFQRLRLRGSLVSPPLLDPIIAIISLSIFLLVALWLINMFNVA